MSVGANKVVIARLVTHDSKVAIFASGSGGRDGELRVAIEKLDGTLVADGITLAELESRDPAIYQVVTSSFASGASGASGASRAADPAGPSGPSYVDATLDLGHLN
jgi:hypothetical protein